MIFLLADAQQVSFWAPLRPSLKQAGGLASKFGYGSEYTKRGRLVKTSFQGSLKNQVSSLARLPLLCILNSTDRNSCASFPWWDVPCFSRTVADRTAHRAPSHLVLFPDRHRLFRNWNLNSLICLETFLFSSQWFTEEKWKGIKICLFFFFFNSLCVSAYYIKLIHYGILLINKLPLCKENMDILLCG